VASAEWKLGGKRLLPAAVLSFYPHLLEQLPVSSRSRDAQGHPLTRVSAAWAVAWAGLKGRHGSAEQVAPGAVLKGQHGSLVYLKPGGSTMRSPSASWQDGKVKGSREEALPN
jgi:hypothetical protein